MKRLLAALAAVAATSTAMVFTTTSASSAAVGATKCTAGSTTYAGTCFIYEGVTAKQIKVEDSVDMINGTSKTKNNDTCAFTSSWTESVSYGAELDASFKASLWDLVEEQVTAKVTKSVTQTKAEADAASASFTLQPGQDIVCQQIYGYYVSTVKEEIYNGNNVTYKTLKQTLPFSTGVRTIDG